MPAREQRGPWWWVPSLYFSSGLPYVVVMTVSVIMYKRLGVSNTELALYTSWLYLPWVIKPLWSPIVDLFGTRRRWVWVMQLLVGASLAGVALALPLDGFLRWSLVFLWLMAFSSATHDIAADGFYMLGLNAHDQAWFVGIRSTCYRIASIGSQGLLVMLAGWLETTTGDVARAWALCFYGLGAGMVLLAGWHGWILPRPAADRPRLALGAGTVLTEFALTFANFFRQPRILAILAFLLFYRLAEAQLVKMAAPFLLDARAVGGLGLATTQVGLIYGTVGILTLTCGGLLGGFLAARNGLRHWLWWMAIAINLPNIVYLYMAMAQPDSLVLINALVALEQLGYGFGFAAYLVFMLQVARGAHETAHYALCTAFMALGMMIPGAFSGWLQESLGYPLFFTWIMLATLPSLLVTAWISRMVEGPVRGSA